MTETRRNGSGTEGFTLVELLVSLSLMMMTAMLLMAALWTGRAVAQRGEAAAAQGETVAAAQDLLRDRIEHLSADPGGPAGGSRETRGDRATFAFVAPSIANREPSALQRYVVGVARGGTLELASIDARARNAAATRARWTEMPLVGNVRAIELAYFGPTNADQTPRWRSSWAEQADPPELVRLRLRFAAGDPRRWPDLIIRPDVTVSAGCRMDRATGECRES